MDPYAELTGDGQVGIHCDLETAELIYEGLCQIFAEYPKGVTPEWKREKRKLAKLKQDIERLLPRA